MFLDFYITVIHLLYDGGNTTLMRLSTNTPHLDLILMTEKFLHDLPSGDDHLREKRISGEDIYGGIFLNMKRDKVSLPDGQEAVREYLTHPGAVAIIAILADGRVLLERQYRYPIAKVCMEIPAGKLDLDEDVHVGDFVHIHGFAQVTSLSQRPGSDKPDRVCMVLTHVACEDEDDEGVEDSEEE